MLTSKATSELLTALAVPGVLSGLSAVDVQSAGGVVVADRVCDGEVADIVVLADGAIERLADGGLVQRPAVPLFESEVVVAVAEGSPFIDVSTSSALRQAFSEAAAIGYSTGPSGDGLLALIESWGLTAQLADRLVRAPAGTPVATLLALGRASIGVQQRSELAGAPGVTVVGALPDDIAIRTVFTGAVLKTSSDPDGAAAVLARLTETDQTLTQLVRHHGMEPHQP